MTLKLLAYAFLVVAKSNEDTALIVISVALAAGLFITWYGAKNGRNVIQKRADAMAELQMEKLSLEVEKLRRENVLTSRENDDG
jgi:hypothetical protein